MKKFLASVLSGLFVLGTAASSFAIHAEIPSESQPVVAKSSEKITLGGEIRVRGLYIDNPYVLNDEHQGPGEDHRSYYDERVRLSLEAKVTSNTTGFVMLESGQDDYFAHTYANTTDTYIWGNTDDGARPIYGAGNAKRGDLRILEAWILHTGSGLLGIPAGVKVGHMPLALGNKLFFDHTKFGDDAIVFFMDPIKELHIGLLTAKFAENYPTLSDDADAYVGLAVYKPMKDLSLSLDVTYVNDQDSTGLGWAGLSERSNPTHAWNFGLRGSYDNISNTGLGLMADVEFQTGEAREEDHVNHDLEGWAVMAGLNYKINPVTLSLTYAYGSGGDSGDGIFDHDGNVGAFVTSLGADQHYTFVYEYLVRGALGLTGTGLANTQYVKLGADADLTKDLTLNAGLYWLQASEDVSLNGYHPDNDLGWELDAKLSYKIDRNLTYWVEGGAFWTGDAYRMGDGHDADDVYAVRHGLQLSF